MQSYIARLLEPWLSLANLLPFEANGSGSFVRLEDLTPDDEGRLHVAFLQQLASRYGALFGVFFQLTYSLRPTAKDRAAGRPYRRSELLLRNYRALREFLEEVPGWSPERVFWDPFDSKAEYKKRQVRDSGSNPDSARKAVWFPMMLFVHGDPEGRIHFNYPRFGEELVRAFEGVELSRIRRCPHCGRFFYAARANKGACDEHLGLARTQRWRDPEKKRRYGQRAEIIRLMKKGIEFKEAKARVSAKPRKRRKPQ